MVPTVRAAIVVAVGIACSGGSARAEPAESVWLAGSFGLGGGRTRLGPVHLSADVEATYWFGERFGAGLTWRGFAADEPDGRGAEGSLYLATATLRRDWISSHHGSRFPARVYATAGLGAGHQDGFDSYGGSMPFDRWAPAWGAAVGVVAAPAWCLLGVQLAVYGIETDFAVVPMYVMGGRL
jgi:hypothetical protein